MQGGLRDADIQEAQLLENRQAERAAVSVGEGAAAEAGDAKGGREAVNWSRQRRRRRRPPARKAQVEFELLEAGEGGGPEPGVQRPGVAAA